MRKIISNQNSIFKEIKKLKSKKFRIQSKEFILEGKKNIRHAINLGYIPRLIAYSSENIFSLNKLRENDADIILEMALFNSISETVNSQGVIAVFSQDEIRFKNKNKKTNIKVFLDKIQEPGNLGTILRTCDAFGFSDVYLSKGTCDPYSSKALRSTAGSIFNLNLDIGFSTKDALNYFRNQGFIIVSSSLDRAENIEVVLEKTKDKNIVLVFGNEGNGVNQDLIENSEFLFKIPMAEKSESLNVATAAAISLYLFSNLKS